MGFDTPVVYTVNDECLLIRNYKLSEHKNIPPGEYDNDNNNNNQLNIQGDENDVEYHNRNINLNLNLNWNWNHNFNENLDGKDSAERYRNDMVDFIPWARSGEGVASGWTPKSLE